MYFANFLLKKTPGLKFYKLLGTGAGAGFSLFPDFSTYSILCVWDDFQAANNFITNSQHSSKISEKAFTRNDYFLKPCLLYTSPSPRDRTRSRMPSSA